MSETRARVDWVAIAAIIAVTAIFLRATSCNELLQRPSVGAYAMQTCATTCGAAGVQSVTDAACTCRAADGAGE